MGSEVCDMGEVFSGKWRVEIIRGVDISVAFSDMASEVFDMGAVFPGK